MAENLFELIVPEEYEGERIDKFCSYSSELDFSRSFLQKLIKNGGVHVNGGAIKANYKVKTDDVVVIEVPEPEEIELLPQDIPLEFVYEDRDIAVINKQPGLVIHPGPGNNDRTMVNALLFHCKDLSGIGGAVRPGIVHRLDKDTSGLMVIAKNDMSHKGLVEQFSQRAVRKKYRAVITGKPKEGTKVIDYPIGRHKKYRHKMTVCGDGKEAVTERTLVKIWNTRHGLFSMVDCVIKTGRTHQIRVHMSAEGNPVVGDPIYSKKWEKHRVPYLLLASVYLGFVHPVTGKELDFETGLPSHMTDFIEKLEKTEY